MTTTRDPWTGRNVERARAYVAATLLPCLCAHCDQLVTADQQWVVGHYVPRWARPDLALDPNNWRPEHRTCSDRSSGDERRRMAQAARAAIDAGLVDPAFLLGPQTQGAPTPPRLSPRAADGSDRSPTDGPVGGENGAEPRLSRPEDFAGVPWLAELLDVPENASWPRYMSPPHPEAVGSYGPQAEAYAQEVLGHPLRWWQRLALYRQLEHRADGSLCWITVAETGPRRIGKSVRLRAGALWRLQHGRRLFGEPQLCIHTGRDLAIVREIQRAAWAYAELAWGMRAVTRANGKEAIETTEGDRWLARAMGAVYGYDTTLGMIDEAWDVPPEVFDEGLEPSTMERKSPQNVLTSTAHRRATILMRRILRAALAGLGEDWSILLLWWGAGRDDDPGDPRVWKAASPHWSPEREALIRSKYERAMRGEADPDAEDPDPMEGFRAQYLNVWPETKAVTLPGEPAVEAKTWADLRVDVGGPGPFVVAVESWFAAGASVAVASRVGERVHVRVVSFETLDEAAAYADALDREALLVGKSLAQHPKFKADAEPIGGMSAREAAIALRALVDDDAVRHDGATELARQVEALRTAEGTDGPRLVSKDRADAVKALVWAATRAREGSAPFVML